MDTCFQCVREFERHIEKRQERKTWSNRLCIFYEAFIKQKSINELIIKFIT
jgi:hypothetical protein